MKEVGVSVSYKLQNYTLHCKKVLVVFLTKTKMIFLGFLTLFLFSCAKAVNDNAEEIPFVVATQGNVNDHKATNLLPDIDIPDTPSFSSQQNSEIPFLIQPAPSSGRSDIEIEKEERTGGYFYPRPSKPFNLPPFKTLAAEEPLDGAAAFSPESSVEEIDRSPRSPQRPGYFLPPRPRPIPSFPGGMTFPGIRPLPALYGRPMNF